MRIGIKYCGGCNARYQREEEVKKLKRELQRCSFTYDVTQICNIWIVVHGCPCACADKKMLKAKLGVWDAADVRDFKQIARRIQKRIREGYLLEDGSLKVKQDICLTEQDPLGKTVVK